MVQPPKPGTESSACVLQYNNEIGGIFEGLKERAKLLTDTFKLMENYSCNEIEGAMYGFPKVEFSNRALKAADEKGVPVDFMYTMDMMERTGIMTVPGSGFGQKAGDWHYRITNLVTPTSDMADMLELLKGFNTDFHDKYS